LNNGVVTQAEVFTRCVATSFAFDVAPQLSTANQNSMVLTFVENYVGKMLFFNLTNSGAYKTPLVYNAPPASLVALTDNDSGVLMSIEGQLTRFHIQRGQIVFKPEFQPSKGVFPTNTTSYKIDPLCANYYDDGVQSGGFVGFMENSAPPYDQIIYLQDFDYSESNYTMRLPFPLAFCESGYINNGEARFEVAQVVIDPVNGNGVINFYSASILDAQFNQTVIDSVHISDLTEWGPFCTGAGRAVVVGDYQTPNAALMLKERKDAGVPWKTVILPNQVIPVAIAC